MNLEHAQTVVTNLTAARGAKETDAVTHFGDACVWTGVRDTDREAWLDIRSQLLTASDVAAILGEDDYKDALGVYVDKVTPRGPVVEPDIDSPMFWGKKLELPIAHAVAEHYGWDIQDGGYLLRSRHCPQVACTLDAEILRDPSEGWIVYEGKTTRLPKGWSEDDGIPTKVLIQAQTQLLVTKAPVCFVFALLMGSRPVRVPVESSPEFHAVIVEQAEWFMDLLSRSEPPEPTAGSQRSLERLYPVANGSTIMLPGECVGWTREIFSIQKQVKELETRESELRNMLRASIGEATYGELPEAVDEKAFWKWAPNAAGAMPLIATKTNGGKAPKGSPKAPKQLLPAPEVDALIAKYGTKSRRRTRR